MLGFLFNKKKKEEKKEETISCGFSRVMGYYEGLILDTIIKKIKTNDYSHFTRDIDRIGSGGYRVCIEEDLCGFVINLKSLYTKEDQRDLVDKQLCTLRNIHIQYQGISDNKPVKVDDFLFKMLTYIDKDTSRVSISEHLCDALKIYMSCPLKNVKVGEETYRCTDIQYDFLWSLFLYAKAVKDGVEKEPEIIKYSELRSAIKFEFDCHSYDGLTSKQYKVRVNELKEMGKWLLAIKTKIENHEVLNAYPLLYRMDFLHNMKVGAEIPYDLFLYAKENEFVRVLVNNVKPYEMREKPLL